jgi:hypothetical protein
MGGQCLDDEHQLKFINPRSLREQLRTALKQHKQEEQYGTYEETTQSPSRLASDVTQ